MMLEVSKPAVCGKVQRRTEMNENEEKLRAKALERIKKKRDFGADLLAYVVVNG